MMNPEDIPYLGAVFRFGAADRVLDTILLAGPVVILAFAAAGRTPITTGLAVLYVGLFVVYVLYKGVRREQVE